jgi:hypothetical protein
VNAIERPIRRFLISTAILVGLGLWLLGVGVYVLWKQQVSLLSGSPLILLGACLLFVALRGAVEVFRGKSCLEEVVSLPLPGHASCELRLPTPMRKGRVFLFFEDTTERFAGTIRLSKVELDHAASVAVNLERLEPSRLKVPNWLPTSDAGDVLENWPRRTGQSTEPVMLTFPFAVKAGGRLKLEFELESNYKGTKLESRFPFTGREVIRIIVKE